MKRKLKILLFTAGVIVTPVLISPLPRFSSPLSTVVEASDGSLLGARIAADGQWRFPSNGSVPAKYEKALLEFEDRWFYFHPGINPASVARAFIGNIRAGKTVSGGSTITMQVARMSGGNRRRTYPAKLAEMLSAIKLELFTSKKNILQMYADNAPFGGNTVGLEAASWRYLGKSSSDITWAEAASLAVLPNSPSLVFPGKNQEVLRSRRDRLLQKLFDRGYIDSMTLSLSTDEPLPSKPGPLPVKAPHLTDFFFRENEGSRVRTTIDAGLQERATEIINRHQKDLISNFIFNSACIIMRVGDGAVLAYVGNSTTGDGSEHGGDVDLIRSLRSTGSILKPLLYAGMLNSGEILPNSLIADIPTRFTGFSPKNFDRSYSGAVPASTALSQSLNIPSVRMLQEYTPERFLELLRNTGFTTFGKDAGHYGLSLILGGGETSLWELTGAYASLSRVLKRFNNENRYCSEDYHPPLLVADKLEDCKPSYNYAPALSASSIWLTYEALLKVNRPESEAGWQYLNSSRNIAWKTGTSFGFRDAWAVGTTPDYVIGVWAGNADGEGRPGLTGISAAAPVLFDLAGLTEEKPWFSEPETELTMIQVCSGSGFRSGPDCPEVIMIPSCTSGLRSEACPYHSIVHLNAEGSFQVTADCVPATEIRSVPWFILPPAMEYFYRQRHPGYKPLPPFAEGCTGERKIPVMEFIYPNSGVTIFIPRDETGTRTHVVSEVAHRNPSKKIFWHLDEEYAGTTISIHQLDIQAAPGEHVLTAVDEDGNTERCRFNITGGAAGR